MTKKIATIIQAMFLVVLTDGIACENDQNGKAEGSKTKQDITASFPCEKAETNIEKMICSNGGVAQLDVSLDELYKDALNRSEDKQKLKDEQRVWLKESRDQCPNIHCLATIYGSRVERLRAYVLERQGVAGQSRPSEGVQTTDVAKEFHELIVGEYRPGSKVYWGTGTLVITNSTISWNGCDQAPFRILKKIHTNFLIELMDDRYCLVHGDKVTHLNLYAKEGGLGIGVDIFMSRQDLERNAWVTSGEYGSRKKID